MPFFIGCKLYFLSRFFSAVHWQNLPSAYSGQVYNQSHRETSFRPTPNRPIFGHWGNIIERSDLLSISSVWLTYNALYVFQSSWSLRLYVIPVYIRSLCNEGVRVTSVFRRKIDLHGFRSVPSCVWLRSFLVSECCQPVVWKQNDRILIILIRNKKHTNGHRHDLNRKHCIPFDHDHDDFWTWHYAGFLMISTCDSARCTYEMWVYRFASSSKVLLLAFCIKCCPFLLYQLYSISKN